MYLHPCTCNTILCCVFTLATILLLFCGDRFISGDDMLSMVMM